MLHGETTIYGIVKTLAFRTFPKKHFEVSVLHGQDAYIVCSSTDIELGKNVVDLLEKSACIKGIAIWDSNLKIEAFFIKEISEFTGSFKNTVEFLKENVDVDKYIQELRNE